MSIIANIFKTILVERPARKHDLAGWAEQIQKDGVALSAKLGNSADSEDHRRVLSHIIGIERWAQTRVKVALGGPFIEEEYNNYRPARDETWQEMRSEFAETRAASIRLAKELAEVNVPHTTVIKHNDFGDMTIRGWLRYITMHGSFEAKRIK